MGIELDLIGHKWGESRHHQLCRAIGHQLCSVIHPGWFCSHEDGVLTDDAVPDLLWQWVPRDGDGCGSNSFRLDVDR